MTRGPLVVDVAELLRRPGSRKTVHTEVTVAGVTVGEARVSDERVVGVDVELESLTDGIVASGTLTAEWEAPCRRCLGPARGQLHAVVRELFQEHRTVEDAYAFEGDQVDLEPMVREALALELPLAPLCRADCQGLCPACGANRNETDCGHRPDLRDLRWAGLDQLRERLEPSGE